LQRQKWVFDNSGTTSNSTVNSQGHLPPAFRPVYVVDGSVVLLVFHPPLKHGTLPAPMDSERRHELQENSLAKFLENLPVFLHVHGSKILLGITLLLALVILNNWRNRSNLQVEENIKVSLGSARDALQQLPNLELTIPDMAAVASRRASVRTTVDSALDTVIANAQTPMLRGEAQLVRGDLYWTLANLPDLPGAATQPALQLPQPRQQLLEQAAAAYGKAISDYPDLPTVRVTAQLGLAAVLQNQGKWDEVRKLYEVIAAQTDLPAYATAAQQQLRLLPQISVPRKIQSITTQPATAPITLPAGPEAPSTQPK
jgi:tetratricopeptide (TPR) repeat protein